MSLCKKCYNDEKCELQDMGCMDSVIACVEFKIKYTDCAGICGFCEIKDTCTNPKRLKLKDCNHESHFISSMERCEKCGDDRE